MKTADRRQQTISSALWAAYGDALGFPTELASADMVQQRLGSRTASAPLAWRRLVGGKFGAEVLLQAGAYSDDTQLRLSTCRAIRSDGSFDVESFAKVELPVWLSYALGAGRGSKAAAESLGNRKSAWFSNFYSAGPAAYTSGGGNGAAMRVQPHVWSAARLEDERSYLSDVVRNAICTHGHVRGIAGAMIHAVTLASVLRSGRLPTLSSWLDLASVVHKLPAIVAQDSELSTFWLPVWEETVGSTLESESRKVAEEWTLAVELVLGSVRRDGRADGYFHVLRELGGLSSAERGSGLKSALFALVAAYEFEPLGTEKALQAVANTLGSDTDTIATMCGALLGARAGEGPPVRDLQDSRYIAEEAERLFKVSQGQPVVSFTYPDLLYWDAPRPLDAVGLKDGRLTLAGLGSLGELTSPQRTERGGTVFQWCRLDFGQSILCKRREMPRSLAKSSQPVLEFSLARSETPKTRVDDLFDSRPVESGPGDEFRLEEMTDLAIRSNFDPALIGEHLLSFADADGGIELAIAYSAIVLKAKRARKRRKGAA